ncbi:hypothetical protein [Luteimonas huabeiensis]|uniref:hypothetical protein n=1 Tax=Luteimonas huabeiensis TaxID=1244513 RepID=UPI000465504A|nr:hypothetical protein [Luteimonas huabeiensis]
MTIHKAMAGLLAAWLLLPVSAPAQDRPAGAAGAPAADAAELAAHRAYTARLAERLTAEGEPRGLALAALLREASAAPAAAADPAVPRADPTSRQWRALALQRAGTDVVALSLLALAPEGDAGTRDAALARWRQLEPANLVPWLHGDVDAPARFEAARRARSADSHLYAQVRVLVEAQRRHPPTEAERAALIGGDGQPGGLDGYAVLHGTGLLGPLAVPALAPFAEACAAAARQAPGSVQAEDCRHAAQALQRADTRALESVGLALAADLARDAEARRAALAALRRFDWQMVALGRLSAGRPAGGVDAFAALLMAEPAGTREAALDERQLREAGIPLDPPAR